MDDLIYEEELEAPLGLVGGKGKTLLKLKSMEQKLNEYLYANNIKIPTFFIVPPNIDISKNYDKILKSSDALKSRYFAVRSSYFSEDLSEHSFDGIFDTELFVTKDKLAVSIQKIRRSFDTTKVKKYFKDVGIKPDRKMPVIVQAMVDTKSFSGVAYSKFPCPNNIVKVIVDDDKYIEAYKRVRVTKNSEEYDIAGEPVVVSRKNNEIFEGQLVAIANVSLLVEQKLGYPVIIEYISCQPEIFSGQKLSILQARKLTKLPRTEIFKIPQLQEKGLIATTLDVNGPGEFTGEAFVIYNNSRSQEITFHGLKKFDTGHRNGYCLVTPFIRFYCHDFDEFTPNKKAVITYSNLARHHDFELARKKGLLYLSCEYTFGKMINGSYESMGKSPIKKGDILRVFSDGIRGYVFNLST